MAAEDFFESEVALAAAATAAILSPRVRGYVRQGLVYGVAGATVAARTVAGAAQSVGRGVADALPIGNDSASNGRTPNSPRATVVSKPRPVTARPRPVAASRARATTKRPAATRVKADPAAPKPGATVDPAAS